VPSAWARSLCGDKALSQIPVAEVEPLTEDALADVGRGTGRVMLVARSTDQLREDRVAVNESDYFATLYELERLFDRLMLYQAGQDGLEHAIAQVEAEMRRDKAILLGEIASKEALKEGAVRRCASFLDVAALVRADDDARVPAETLRNLARLERELKPLLRREAQLWLSTDLDGQVVGDEAPRIFYNAWSYLVRNPDDLGAPWLESPGWLLAERAWRRLENYREFAEAALPAPKRSLYRDLYSGAIVGRLFDELRTELHGIVTLLRPDKAPADLDDCVDRIVDHDYWLGNLWDQRDELERNMKRIYDDPLDQSAAEIAEGFIRLLAQSEGVSTRIDNARWAGMWWRAGVALQLAGETSASELVPEALRVRPLAAPSTDPVPGALADGPVAYMMQGYIVASAEPDRSRLPPSASQWMVEAARQVDESEGRLLRIRVPLGTAASLDGAGWVEGVDGIATMPVRPGVHRLTVQFPDRIRSVNFQVDPSLDAAPIPVDIRDPDSFDAPDLLDFTEVSDSQVAYEQVLEYRPRTWFGGVWLGAASIVGQPMFGGEASVTWAPILPSRRERRSTLRTSVGLDLGAALFVPLQPLQIDRDWQLQALFRGRGGLAVGGFSDRWSLHATLGWYADPHVGTGPMGQLTARIGTHDPVTFVVSAQVGGDISPHEAGIPRLTFGGGLGIGF
jgi:hypothetical protein